jgi:hypothetical protein
LQVSILLITDGQDIEYAPEIYSNREQAIREAEHWTWLLSAGGEFEVRHPFEGRWEVGIRDVRLVAVSADGFDPSSDWWVGVHWTTDGFPDPEGVLLEGRSAALEWVSAPIASGSTATAVQEDPWLLAATFAERGGQSMSIALRAKVISASAGLSATELVEYEVELVGTFVQSISGSVQGAPGLNRDQIEELVDRNWAILSIGTEVLLESDWELEAYRELS